jgi:DNA replication and repair protein RecF
MPVLKRILVQDFRNIALAELAFSPKINCVSGNNGAGKTNLLDAIWYLSMTKSAFSASDRYNFRDGRGTFSISGTYEMENGTVSVFSISVADGGEKKLRRDDCPVKKVSEHIGTIPIVMVSPSDTALVSESGDERRRFTNTVLSQMSPAYLADAQQYNRLLRQRNRVLKDPCPDAGLLDVFDARMSPCAARIYAARKEFVRRLSPAVARFYAMISGGGESVSAEYVSDFDAGAPEDVFASRREKDLALRFTTAGVQRDDLVFLIDGHPIRRFGSQGQQKSFLVALKFAQYELMREDSGFPPMLLLDDVFDKLDMGRISNLLSMVAGRDFGQIFITDSNKVRMAGIVEKVSSGSSYFEASAGAFTKIEDNVQGI